MSRDATGSHAGLDEAHISVALEEHEQRTLPMLHTLWTCYRNPSTLVGSASCGGGGGGGGGGSGGGQGRRLRQALEAGLPRRVRAADAHGNPREIVIENDIAWRIHTMVDFVAGKPMTIRSRAAAEPVRRNLDTFFARVLDQSGGMAMLQDASLLAHVFGYVDFIVRADIAAMRARAGHGMVASLADVADLIRVEPVDPRRGVAILDEADYRLMRGYVIRAGRGTRTDASAPERAGTLVERLAQALARRRGTREEREYVEVVTREASVLRVNGRAARTQSNAWAGGRVPIVHVQNVAQPFAYAGLSDVEPLLPLVDELNTRLSDRANRVALQSFKMYLAKGIDGFEKAPIAPGMVWSTDNPDASIQAFGGDSDAPSEATHITEIREALDKVSGVPPLASGVVRAKLGNLTSATALRITLMGLIARTQRKRLLMGRGIAEVCDLALAAAEHAGLIEVSASDRVVTVEWPDPVPVETPQGGALRDAGGVDEVGPRGVQTPVAAEEDA